MELSRELVLVTILVSPENHGRMVTFFVEHGNSTKRFSGDLSGSVDDIKNFIRTKIPSLGENFDMKCKDQDFDVVCDVEDVSQVYHGAKLTITEKDAQQNEPMKLVEDMDGHLGTESMVAELSARISELERENGALRIQLDNQAGEHIEMLEGFPVRCTGAPYHVAENDVRTFFDGLTIVEGGITIMKQFMSDAARGEILVTFATQEDANAALLKHKQNIGNRWIEVRVSTLEDYRRYNAIQDACKYLVTPCYTFQPYIACLKGFEYGHKVEDLEKFLEPITPLKIWIIYNKRSQNSGVVYVELSTKQDLNAVLSKKREYIGERWVDVWESNETRFKVDLAQMIGQEIKKDDTIPGCKTLRMQGIPREATDNEIARFFRAVGILPSRIHRKQTGDSAFIEFVSESECQIGFSRNHQYIGSRYINLKMVPFDEVANAVPHVASQVMYSDLPERDVYERRTSPVYERPLNPSYTPYERERTYARSHQPYSTDSRLGSGHATSRQNRSGGRGGNRQRHPPAAPNPIVKLTGLPFSSQLEDVVNFFEGYKFDETSVKFLEKDGRPTGTARVTFDSTAEASIAIQEKNKKFIGERYVRLSYWAVKS